MMRRNRTLLNNKIFYSCLIVAAAAVVTLKYGEQKFVNDINDFKTHTSTHIKNVYSLGMHLYFKYKSTLFRDVPEHVIREKLRMHDFEKIASREQLARFGYKDSRSILERLYDSYGQQKEHLNGGLVVEMDYYAKQYDRAIFKKFAYLKKTANTKSIAHKVALIEKIADLVERERNPISIEEFGVGKMRPASEFLQSDLEKTLAEELAKDYPFIVQPNPLIYTASKKSFPVCLRRCN